MLYVLMSLSTKCPQNTSRRNVSHDASEMLAVRNKKTKQTMQNSDIHLPVNPLFSHTKTGSPSEKIYQKEGRIQIWWGAEAYILLLSKVQRYQ